MPRELGLRTWTEMSGGPPLIVVPVGSLEQHGPHLPLDTDTRIATAVAAELSSAVGGLVAPAIAYGNSGEHADFAGTISLGHAALKLLIVEFGRSAGEWAPRLLFVNGHGGNTRSLAAAVGQLRTEGRDVAWLPCAAPGMDAHAGHAETSLLLHLCPEVVHTDRLESGNTTPLAELIEQLRSAGVRGVSGNGVLGDPRRATPGDGESLFAALAGRAVSAARAWTPDSHGRLR